MYHSYEKYVFPEFVNMSFKAGDANVDSKVSHIFLKVFNVFYDIVQHYIPSE